MVLIRVDGATELGNKINQSEAAAANVRVFGSGWADGTGSLGQGDSISVECLQALQA